MRWTCPEPECIQVYTCVSRPIHERIKEWLSISHSWSFHLHNENHDEDYKVGNYDMDWFLRTLMTC